MKTLHYTLRQVSLSTFHLRTHRGRGRHYVLQAKSSGELISERERVRDKGRERRTGGQTDRETYTHTQREREREAHWKQQARLA